MAISATGGTITYAGGNTIHTFSNSSNEINSTPLLSDANLKAYWRLENTTDSGSSANTLTNVNSTSFATGKFSNGADLELSSSQYFTASNHSSLQISTDISISVWAKPESLSGNHTIVGKGRANGDVSCNYQLGLDSSGKIRFVYASSGPTFHTWTSTSAYATAGTFLHIAITYTFGTGAGFLCYVNGASASGSWTSGTGNSAVLSNTEVLQIGCIHSVSGADEFFDGIIDDLAIFDRILTSSEIKAINYGGFLTVTSGGTVNHLIVAGGGGGGSAFTTSGGASAGGGGAGGFKTGTSSVTAQTYAVVVGNGGSGKSDGTSGGSGGDSSFNSITSTGGGGGAKGSATPGTNGVTGGSGGGGGGQDAGSTTTGGSGTGSEGTAGGNSVSVRSGAGGGGATSAGSNATVSSSGGNGGNGTASSITGSSVTYAGGGGGGSWDSANISTGGTGGGGNGGRNTVAGVAGTDGLGGGGGGGATPNGGPTVSGGNGGSGVVIISYTTPPSQNNGRFYFM